MATTSPSPASASSPQAIAAAANAAQNASPPQQAQQQVQAKKRFLKNPFRRNKDKKAQHGKALVDGRDEMQKNGAFGQAWTTPPKKIADGTEEGAGSELSENFTVFSDPIDAVGGAVGGVGGYIGQRADYDDSRPGHAEAKPDDQKDTQGEHTAGVMGATGSGLGTLTSGLTVIAGGLGAWDNFRQLHQMRVARKAGKDISRLEMADVGLQGGGNAIGAVSSTGTLLADAGGTGAGIAATNDATNAAASTAASAFGGLGDTLGAIGGSVQLLVSGARLGLGVAKNISAMKDGGDADWAAIGTDSLSVLKGFLSTANSTVSAISAFLQMAGAAAELANAMPAVGAAVNICIQLLDIVIQVINVTKAVVKMVKAKSMEKKLAAAESTATGSDKSMLGHLGSIQHKRYNRQILPLVTSLVTGMADLISIGGSVMNICGVATSPAYGAGVAVMAVGYGMSATAGLVKLGTALAGPIAALHRKHKQFGRDVKSNDAGHEKTGRVANFYRSTGFANRFTGPSTKSKNDQYEETIGNIYQMLSTLPATFTDQEAAKFEHAHMVLKATGVSTKQLYKTTSEVAASDLLLDALKRRG